MTINVSDWRVARASRQGSKNLAREQECQDHSICVLLPSLNPDAIVAAVADGIGSAPLSDRGARIATNVAVFIASHLLSQEPYPLLNHRMETILYTAMLSARQRIEHVAQRDNLYHNDLATTLLLAVHADDLLGTAQIGDGAAVVSTGEGSFKTFTRPQKGEYSNETNSVTSRRSLQLCNIDIAQPPEPLRTLALMTDGVVSISLDSRELTPHQPFFETMANWLREHPERPHPNRELGDLLQSEKIRSKTDDDTTMILATRA